MKKIFLLLSLATILFSCKIFQVPAYSSDAVVMVESASNATDVLYTNIIASQDKSYSTYQPNYEIINSQINDILVLDSSRKGSTSILIIANDIKKRFATYEAEHKESGSLNERELNAFKYGMHALWSSLYNAEKNFKPKK